MNKFMLAQEKRGVSTPWWLCAIGNLYFWLWILTRKHRHQEPEISKTLLATPLKSFP